MQISVHIQVQDDDAFDKDANEVAQAVLEALDGDAESDLVNVTVQPAPTMGVAGASGNAPVFLAPSEE